MPFDYYQRLSPKNQRIYRRSDELTSVPLPQPRELTSVIEAIEESLQDDRRRQVQEGCQELVDRINRQLATPPSRVRVLAARPSRDWGELHGLYEPLEEDHEARITVWMRTAQRKQIVAFRTFLRTLLHELCHHLDYEHFGLAETFHTEGFFKRESSLFHQLRGDQAE